MTTPDPHDTDSPAVPADGAAGELTDATATDAPAERQTLAFRMEDADRSVAPATSELPIEGATPSIPGPDEIGPTVVCIPIRNELAAARIAHALTNAREAQALIDEAVELLATVRDLHVETYQLGAARGAIRETLDLLARRAGAGVDADGECPAPPVDLKNDPTYEEIATWMSFGIPVTS